ncbi:hypothetical protein H8D30_00935 [bacterium]|nr:hypothetical protein [bacterium]
MVKTEFDQFLLILSIIGNVAQHATNRDLAKVNEQLVNDLGEIANRHKDLVETFRRLAKEYEGLKASLADREARYAKLLEDHEKMSKALTAGSGH